MHFAFVPLFVSWEMHDASKKTYEKGNAMLFFTNKDTVQ